MALPAGRYGVTKNQLLKIKKLPMNTIKLIEELTEKFDLLGTAAFKNSTSVVTQSTDLVESGAVYDGIKSAYQLVEDTVGFNGQNYIKPTQGDVSTSGVKFIRNSDNSITVIDGPTTGGCVYLFDSAFTCKANKKYRLKGCPSGGGTEQSNYWVGAYIDSSITDERKDTGSGCVFSFDADTVINIRLRLPSGFTPPNDFTFYPMLTDANNLNSTYVPNHPSVDELKADNSVIAPTENGTTASQAYAVGEHFTRDGAFCTVTQAISQGGSFTLNTNYIEEDISAIISRLLITSPESQFNGNCNDLPTGFAYVTNSATNAPEAWSIILTYSTSIRSNTGGYLTQIAYPANGNDYFYKRTKINGVWQSWVKYSPIKSATFSGTTNASGNFSITTDLTRVVLGIELDNDQTALKYKTSNYIGIHIMNASSLEAYASQPVSGTYYYI